MTPEELLQLTDKYLDGTASEEEKKRLQDWYMQGAAPGQELESPLSAGHTDESSMEAALFEKIKLSIGNTGPLSTPVRRMHWKRWVAAASILLLLCLGSYILFFRQAATPNSPTTITTIQDLKAPSSNRATITLANGKKIFLDELSNGELARQNGVSIRKLDDGKISYDPAKNETPLALLYNTLDNPRGSKVIDIQLADGSHVWLNAGSSITYPVSFAGNERRVSITGEAYFEVAHDGAKPFYVSKGDMQVQVLGTHFNVNAYDDEDAIKVTLLEGSVEVNNQQATIKIIPGQQARAVHGELSVVNNIDLDQAVAWKNGLFSFDKATIQTLLRSVSRWYDIDIAYEGAMPKGTISGKAQRSLNFEQMQKVLQLNDVKFRIENNKLVVSP